MKKGELRRDRGRGTSYHKLKYQQRPRRQRHRSCPPSLIFCCTADAYSLTFSKGNPDSDGKQELAKSLVK